jgi:hypothetical protein
MQNVIKSSFLDSGTFFFPTNFVLFMMSLGNICEEISVIDKQNKSKQSPSILLLLFDIGK